MIKSLGIGLTFLTLLFNVVVAETVTKKAEGLFISDKAKGKIAMETGQRVIINAASTLGGELTLNAGSGNCKYTYAKILKTPTRVEAEEYAEVISVEVEKVKDAVVISLRAPARAPWAGTTNSGRLTIEIFIPDNCAVEINTAYFGISATGPFSEFKIPESLSRVEIENVNGPVEVKVSNRPLIIKNVVGKLLATNKYGRLRLENIDTGENGGTVRNERGEISIDGYRGGLDARTSYDLIIGQNLFLTGNKNRIKNTSAAINLTFDSLTTGKLRINNQYENINLEIRNRVDAQFICKTGEDGAVTAEHLDIVPLLVDENRLEFRSGKGTAEIRLTARKSGDITINGQNRQALQEANR